MPLKNEALPNQNWQALVMLENRVGYELCSHYMMMNVIREAGINIYLYKHLRTRRYLNLSSSGILYRYLPRDGAVAYEPLGDDIANQVIKTHIDDCRLSEELEKTYMCNN